MANSPLGPTVPTPTAPKSSSYSPATGNGSQGPVRQLGTDYWGTSKKAALQQQIDEAKNQGYARAAAKNAPMDPMALYTAKILGLLDAQVPGTPGHMVSQAAIRGSLQKSYDTAEKNRKNVFAQINDAIMGRASDISAGYQGAGQAILANAANRQQSGLDAAAALDNAAAQAASRFGFTGMAPSASSRSDAALLENLTQSGNIADAWDAYMRAGEQTALQGNTAVADAFQNTGVQQQRSLADQLQGLLAQYQDYYVGGSAAHSALTTSQKISALDELMYRQQNMNELNAKVASDAAPTVKTTVANNNGKPSTSTTTTYKATAK